MSNKLTNIVYAFCDKHGEIIYIGRAKNAHQRFREHNHLPKECYQKVRSIRYIQFNTWDESKLAEGYFIAKKRPYYNTQYKNSDIKLTLTDLDKKKWLLYAEFESPSKSHLKEYRRLSDLEKKQKCDNSRLISKNTENPKIEAQELKNDDSYLPNLRSQNNSGIKFDYNDYKKREEFIKSYEDVYEINIYRLFEEFCLSNERNDGHIPHKYLSQEAFSSLITSLFSNYIIDLNDYHLIKKMEISICHDIILKEMYNRPSVEKDISRFIFINRKMENELLVK